MHKSSKIFVLEIASAPDLAFEAETATQAVAFTRAPWFRDAVRSFLAGMNGTNGALNAQRIRAATAAEAGIYRQLSEEFDGPTRQFLVADLSAFPERHAGKSAAAVL
jgi:hypothetical protein